MSTMPHDVTDLYLAPVVLAVDARIEELAELDLPHLGRQVALVSDLAEWTRDLRETALLRTIDHLIDLHGWELSWDPRGIRMTHGAHRLVLGVPATFAEFVAVGSDLRPAV